MVIFSSIFSPSLGFVLSPPLSTFLALIFNLSSSHLLFLLFCPIFLPISRHTSYTFPSYLMLVSFPLTLLHYFFCLYVFFSTLWIYFFFHFLNRSPLIKCSSFLLFRLFIVLLSFVEFTFSGLVLIFTYLCVFISLLDLPVLFTCLLSLPNSCLFLFFSPSLSTSLIQLPFLF